MEFATKQTDGPALRAIYELLASGLGYLSETMSTVQRTALVERLNGFLAEEDMTVFMYAMGTLARLYAAGVKDAETCACEEFFDGKKSKHLLAMACGNVLAAVTEGRDTVVELIKVAQVIVSTVSSQQRNIFLRTKVAEKTMSSLWAKLEKIGRVEEPLVEVLIAFAMTLYPETKPPKALLEFVCLRVEASLKEELQGRSDLFAAKGVAEVVILNDRVDLVSEMFRSSLLLSSSGSLAIDTKSTARVSSRLNCIQEVTKLLSKHPRLQEELNSCMLRNDFSSPLKRFMSYRQPAQATHACCNISTTASTCESTLRNAQASLHSALRNLIIRASLLATTRLPSTAFALELLTLPTTHPLICAAFPTTPASAQQPVISLLEAPSTQQPAQSKNWRARLSTELAQAASQTHSSLISSLGEICKDLEARCEDIETPLRELEAKMEEVKKELEGERQNSTSLRDLLKKSGEELDKAGEQIVMLEERMDKVVEMAEEKAERAKAYKKDWEDVQVDLEKEAGKRLAAQGEVGLLRSQLRELETEKEQLLSKIQHLEEDHASLSRNFESLRTENSQLDQKVRDSENEVENLTMRSIALEDEITEKEHRIRENEDMITSLEADVQAASEKTAVLNSSISGLERTLEAERQAAHEKFSSLMDSLTEAETSTEKALAQIAQLEAEKAKIGAALVEKEGELEEARIAAANEYAELQDSTAKKIFEQAEALSTLQKTHESLAAAHSDLETSHTNLQTSHGSLSSAHSELEVSHSELQTTYENLSTAHNELQTSHTTLQTTHTTLQRSHSTLTAQYQTLKTTLADLQASYKEKSAQLKHMQGLHAQLSAFLQPQIFPATPQAAAAAHQLLASSPPSALRDVTGSQESRWNSSFNEKVDCTPSQEGKKKDRERNSKRKRVDGSPAKPAPLLAVPRKGTRRSTVTFSRAATTMDGWQHSKGGRQSTPLVMGKTPGRKGREMSAPVLVHGDAEKDELDGLNESFFSEDVLSCSTPKEKRLVQVGEETTMDF